MVAPRNASGVCWTGSQPRCDAQLTAAGAVIARRPATTPISRARRYRDIDGSGSWCVRDEHAAGVHVLARQEYRKSAALERDKDTSTDRQDRGGTGYDKASVSM